LTRRLEREGRLFPPSYTVRRSDRGADDQCTAGLNFVTVRPRREILADYKKILQGVYDPAAYYARVRTIIRMLDQPALGKPALDKCGAAPSGVRLGGVSRAALVHLWRLVWRIALRQPRTLVHFGRALYLGATKNPRALEAVGLLTALYLHLGPFSRFVSATLDDEIAIADSDEFRAPTTIGREGCAIVEANTSSSRSLAVH